MLYQSVVIIFFATLLGRTELALAATPPADSSDDARESVSFPLPPKYAIEPNGSVRLRICFNWSCSSRANVTFTPDDMALLTERMTACSGQSLNDRLQRLRIGIWQMELLAQKYLPILANDRAINDFEVGVKGRMDCIDNSTNTTNYLHVLKDMGALTGWIISSPKVRNRFDLNGVHWTAVIMDTETGLPWSLDSWYRPNGHLPMVMPLESWIQGKKGWEPPFERLNATPHSVDDLCDTPRPLEPLPPTGKKVLEP
jgi:hypothetical protein